MRLIDADALIEKWYEVNKIGPEDRGARFIGYTEIPRFINNAPTVELIGDRIKRAFEIEYARESENMRKRNAQLEVMLNAQKAISADAVHGEWEHWGSPFSDEDIIDTIVCSVCGARFIEPKDEPKGEYNFCPNCGAIMKGGDSE